MHRPATSADTVNTAFPPSAAAGAEDPVIDESGHFHATDAPIDLSHYPMEAWLAFGLFWLLALTIFYQFITRYALNDSAAWTEEIARYLLIGTVFVAISAGVRMRRHIHVDFLYRYLPRPLARGLAVLVDVTRIGFFAAATVLTAMLMSRMGNYKMTIVDLPMNIVYGICLVGFAFATVRALQVAIEDWRRGWSMLERPESAIEEVVS